MYKAALFDMDGVLIETEKETFKFYQEELKNQGIILKDKDFKYKAGRKSVDFWNDVLTEEEQKKIDVRALTNLKREMFNMNPEKYIKKVEGGKEVLATLKNKEIRLALVTQNELRMANSSIDWLGIRELFDVILTIEDIENLKPSPEIYLLAAKKLGAIPAECIVIEDSRDGVVAAKNAEMTCIGINHPYTPKDALDKSDYKINNLNEILNYF